MMDKLVLKGLKFRANHGYFENERVEGNDFEVDLIFKLFLKSAGEHDDLSKTIDYYEAQKIVASVMNGEPVKLIETLVLRIGNKLDKELANVDGFSVTVRKLNPPMEGAAEYSEVTMKWPL